MEKPDKFLPNFKPDNESPSSTTSPSPHNPAPSKSHLKSISSSSQQEPPTYDEEESSNTPVSSPSRKFRYRTSPLIADNHGLGSKFSYFKDNLWSRTQLSPHEIERSVWIVLNVPFEIELPEASHGNDRKEKKGPREKKELDNSNAGGDGESGDLGLSMSLKYLYPYDEKVKQFAALRLMGLEVDLVVDIDPSTRSEWPMSLPTPLPSTSSTKTKGKGKAAGSAHPDHSVDVQTILSFSASTLDDAPTLSMNMDLDLSSFSDLRTEKIWIPAMASYRLQARAKFEYFNHRFTASWAKVPLSIVFPGSQARTAKNSTDEEARLLVPAGGQPLVISGEAAASSTDFGVVYLGPLRTDTLPIYEEHPASEPVLIFFASIEQSSSPCFGGVNFEPSERPEENEEEPPSFDALPGQALFDAAPGIVL